MDRGKTRMAMCTDCYERVMDLLLVTTMSTSAKEVLMNRFKDLYASIEDLYDLVEGVELSKNAKKK